MDDDLNEVLDRIRAYLKSRNCSVCGCKVAKDEGELTSATFRLIDGKWQITDAFQACDACAAGAEEAYNALAHTTRGRA